MPPQILQLAQIAAGATVPAFRIVTDSLGVVNLTIAVLLSILVYTVAKGIIKKSNLDIMKSTNEALTLSVGELNTRITHIEGEYQKKVAILQETSLLTDKRLMRIEIDAQRKGIQLNQAREEVRMLEMAVNVAVNCLSSDNEKSTEYTNIMQILTDLREARNKAALQLDQWEEAQANTLAFNDTKTDMNRGKAVVQNGG